MSIWRNAKTLDRAFIALLAVVAATLAWRLNAGYAAAPDLLWRDFYHDRNGHFANGVSLAVAARHFDVLGFLAELERAKVWPPVHDLLVGLALLITGIDYTHAIVADVIGCALTLVMSAILARRLFDDRGAGLLAAAVAFIFAAGSPAFRLLGSDVMFEAWGAALSALAILGYLFAQEQPQRVDRWRALALILTALFFLKGNYWGLAAMALAVAAIAEAGSARVAALLKPLRDIEIGALLRSGFLDPLLWTFGLLVLLVGYLYARGPTVVVLFGRDVSLYPPENLVTVAYAVLFIRIARAWWAHRAALHDYLRPAGRTLLYWHIAPVLVSFLLPKRLSAFLWYVGPSNATTSFDVPAGIRLYWAAFWQGFHANLALALAAVALAFIGLFGLRWLRPRAAVIFIFIAVCAVALVVHPQHQGRFLGSLIFAVWVAAGAGAGVLFTWVVARRSAALRFAIAAAASVALAAANIWQPPSVAANAVAIRTTSGPSDLDLLRPYIGDLDGLHRVAFVTTFGIAPLFSWMLRTRCRCEVAVENPFIFPASREDARRMMLAHVAGLRSDIMVLINAPHGRYELPILGLTYDRMVGVVDAMREQKLFVLQSTHELPSEGAVVTIWRRAVRSPG